MAEILRITQETIINQELPITKEMIEGDLMAGVEKAWKCLPEEVQTSYGRCPEIGCRQLILEDIFRGAMACLQEQRGKLLEDDLQKEGSLTPEASEATSRQAEHLKQRKEVIRALEALNNSRPTGRHYNTPSRLGADIEALLARRSANSNH